MQPTQESEHSQGAQVPRTRQEVESTTSYIIITHQEVTNDLTYKVNHEMREKITNKDKSDKYRLELMELQDKYQQLVFNSRVAAPTNLNTPLARKATFVSQHSDEGE